MNDKVMLVKEQGKVNISVEKKDGIEITVNDAKISTKDEEVVLIITSSMEKAQEKINEHLN